MNEVKTINWEEFVDKYHPVKNHINKYASYNNCMFETFGEELAYIVNLSNNEESKKFVWTIIDGENEDIFDFVDKKFAVLSILSTINFVNEWYKPEGKMNAAEIAEKLSSFILGGLRKKATLNR